VLALKPMAFSCQRARRSGAVCYAVDNIGVYGAAADFRDCLGHQLAGIALGGRPQVEVWTSWGKSSSEQLH